MSEFVHLHTHSEFSLLDGLGKLDHLIERAKSFGMDSLALTDHGAMYGSFKFYLKAKAAGIKPILGVETYVARRSHLDKEGKQDTDPYHLVLLAENEVGYRNLLKLVTIAHLEGYYYKPRIDWELLKEHREGLICLSACLQGEISKAILAGNIQEARDVAKRYGELFGPDHYYIELQRHPAIPECDRVNEGLVALAKELALPIVATNDIHYVDADDAEAQEILLCVQTQHTIVEKNRPLSMIGSPDFFMRSPTQMKDLFAQYPEAIDNTIRIANMCDITLSVGKWILPDYPIEKGETPASHLRKLVWERASSKYPTMSEEIRSRLAYELDIIDTKGYSTYFLIVADFVNWAKDHGIAVGPGRGSAAGSLVTLILGITGIDPLYFKLPFERFLNPYRPSAPDIDLDFADDRRDEVIAYVTQKYGEDKVAQICTFGTMEARGAVRDGGRALGLPYSAPDRIAKMIPQGAQGFPMTIEKALDMTPELAHAYRTEPETKRLLDVAKKLEGVARHVSVHAAGVVIADKPLVEYTPLQKETKGEKIVTQYDMYTIGEDGVGLLKMDFLGLRNLTIMSQTIELIKKVRGQTVDLSAIPLDNAKTYRTLSEGETAAVFQLESSGMRRYIKELKPTTIFDLMAMVALFRPGPMLAIPEFIKRKHNPRLITYPDPRLKDALAQSYGLICYQDDVLLTAISVAGYSWGDADKLRKAVGKKIPSEMKKQKEKFIAGCIQNGVGQKKAEELFTLIEPFAGYGFNKAHAACYAMIAYRTAYLKANYPVEFMTAVLSAESRGNTGPAREEKIAMMLSECKRMGVPILPPDINASDVDFTIEKGSVRFGLTAIKNVGTAAIESIRTSRTADGHFRSLSDFLHRVDLSRVNSKTIESLIKAGALSTFGKKSVMLAVLPGMLSGIHKKKRSVAAGQAGLFDLDASMSEPSMELPDLPELSQDEILAYEKEHLGFYVTAHPLESVRHLLDSPALTRIADLTPGHVGAIVTLAGIVTTIKHVTTKTGNHEMAFVRLEDFTGTIELIVFPKIYARTADLWVRDRLVHVRGRVDEKEDRILCIVEEAQLLQ